MTIAECAGADRKDNAQGARPLPTDSLSNTGPARLVRRRRTAQPGHKGPPFRRRYRSPQRENGRNEWNEAARIWTTHVRAISAQGTRLRPTGDAAPGRPVRRGAEEGAE